MSINVEVKISWLEEFLKKVDTSRKEVNNALNSGIKKVLFYTEAEAKTETPVDTGTLRNSYRQVFGNLYGQIFNFRKYGVFVHEGTKFSKGNPFLTRTVANTESEVNKIFEEEIIDFLPLLND